MRYLLNSSEMRQCDSQTSDYFLVPSICLMERAAAAAAEEMMKTLKKEQSVLIVCGCNNNGGDGMAIARILYLNGFHINVFLVGEEAKCKPHPKQQLAILRRYQVPVFTRLHNLDFSAYDIIADAMFGIGLNRPVEGVYGQLAEAINQSGAMVYSIDIPSGLNADNGQIMGVCVKADVTITFAFEKLGLYLYPGADCAGTVICKDIGITKDSFLEMKPTVYTLDASDLKGLFPERKHNSNKGSYGKLTLLVGSDSMAGAAFFAAMAAYRTGCGLVRIITPQENRTILQTLLPEAVLTVYDRKHPDKEQILEAVAWSNVVGMGCGLGNDEDAWTLLSVTLDAVCEKKLPCVLDADALNLLANHQDRLQALPDETIITPHLGEMGRLTHRSIQEIKCSLLTTAQQASKDWNVCCVLKDARTFVTAPGEMAYLNLRGCNGMATGGSGDVLTGIICGLLALGLPANKSAVTGVLLHALSGEEADRRKGNASMLARDLLDGIATVLNRTFSDNLS